MVNLARLCSEVLQSGLAEGVTRRMEVSRMIEWEIADYVSLIRPTGFGLAYSVCHCVLSTVSLHAVAEPKLPDPR